MKRMAVFEAFLSNALQLGVLLLAAGNQQHKLKTVSTELKAINNVADKKWLEDKLIEHLYV